MTTNEPAAEATTADIGVALAQYLGAARGGPVDFGYITLLLETMMATPGRGPVDALAGVAWTADLLVTAADLIPEGEEHAKLRTIVAGCARMADQATATLEAVTGWPKEAFLTAARLAS